MLFLLQGATFTAISLQTITEFVRAKKILFNSKKTRHEKIRHTKRRSINDVCRTFYLMQ